MYEASSSFGLNPRLPLFIVWVACVTLVGWLRIAETVES